MLDSKRRSIILIVGIGLAIGLISYGKARWALQDTHREVDPPYPLSSVIAEVSFGVPQRFSQTRAGDNWPVTWADDGHLYTAWGDGGGFDPQIGRVSMGFARVEGIPQDLRGYNIRSPDEQHGDGRRGRKASGMLMVDGVLYMLARNADREGRGCQLAWSTDRAMTWTWSEWSFTEFGYCAFVNYGQNYSGSRDNYVYIVSHDDPSAYNFTDGFVLARVPQDQIAKRDGYEFFVDSSADGGPIWSGNINSRGTVFATQPGRAQRSSISYNAELGRYLWWQAGWPNPDGSDSRFNSGPLGIFDAPELWGPWTTVFYTEDFPGGPGETGSFPTKWMEPIQNGHQRIYMLNSRDDAFSVWPVTLTLGLGS